MENDIDIDELVSYIMVTNDIPNIPLQKYYQLKWFINALKKDTFTFQKPSTWNDPFEDFLSQLSNKSTSAVVNGFNITDHIYAMSTINKKNECDGMWRNFSNSTGVLVHTSSKKIITSIVRFLLDKKCFSNRKSYQDIFDIRSQLAASINLRKIKYKADSGIADIFIRATEKINDDPDYYKELSFETLSIKKKEYEYESEYRVFLIAKHFGLSEAEHLNAGYFVETINKVVLSPIAKKNRVNLLNCLLIKKYKIDKSLIVQSKLYSIENFKRVHGFLVS